jgi:predicted Zn-ribbon and HTH transcriptional regulator
MTGKIVFVPVCSRCKHILIEEPIDYVKKENPLDYPIKVLHTRYHFYEEDFEIKPYYCPNCKSVFTSIVAPGKFPVNVQQLFEFADE